MVNGGDNGQSMSEVTAVGDQGPDIRENIPPAFRYGKVESISIAPMARWRAPDNNVTTYTGGGQMIFYLETGGAAFLNPKETYLTFTFTPTNVGGANTIRCMLDHSTDALFSELQLQVNGTIVEHLFKLNLFCNIKDLLEEQAPYTVSVNCQSATITAQAGPTFAYNDPVYNAYLMKADNSWFGKSSSVPRRGEFLSSATNYQMAYHVKSALIGQNATTAFPLAFINMCMLTLMIESDTRSLRECSYTTASGAIVNAGSTWTTGITKVKLHYTLIMVQDEVAASIQKAYLSNALPNYMHSIRTYTWVQSSSFNTTSIVYNFSVSCTSADCLYIVLLQDANWSTQAAASLSNFQGGYTYVQVKVNGQAIPSNKIDLANGSYELFRQIAYSQGKTHYGNQGMPTTLGANSLGFTNAAASQSLGYQTKVTAGNVAAAPVTYGPSFTYQAGAVAVNNTNGLPYPEFWNACGNAQTISTTAAREQGCTVIVVPLTDAWAMKGQNVKCGTAIRGANIQFEATLDANCPASSLHCFISQDGLLVMKGTSAGLLT